MANQTSPRAAIAMGFPKGLMRRIVVSFDDETFDQVRALAQRSSVSFGEAVRQLVEVGLLEVESQNGR